MKVGDLVIPKDKGWKTYRKTMGIVVDIYCYDSITYDHWPPGNHGQDAISVLWFDGSSHRNEWSVDHLEIVSESR